MVQSNMDISLNKNCSRVNINIYYLCLHDCNRWVHRVTYLLCYPNEVIIDTLTRVIRMNILIELINHLQI